MYCADVWAIVIITEMLSDCVLGIQLRAELRVTCSYRLVPVAAVMVLAGVIPLDLLAVKRREILFLTSD
ncbi:hypothetical protein J6590_081156 [Homalodisca vitripennis]|nr:hypothetical protein J6590_081156 [Homalodisca vitripennis]